MEKTSAIHIEIRQLKELSPIGNIKSLIVNIKPPMGERHPIRDLEFLSHENRAREKNNNVGSVYHGVLTPLTSRL